MSATLKVCQFEISCLSVRVGAESDFSLLTLLQDWRCARDAGLSAQISPWCGKQSSRIYILRVHALELLQNMRVPVEQTCSQNWRKYEKCWMVLRQITPL